MRPLRRQGIAYIRTDLHHRSTFNDLYSYEQWFAFCLLTAPAEHLDGSLTIDFDRWAEMFVSSGEPADPAMLRIAFYSLLVAGWLDVEGDRVYVSERIGKRPAGPYSLATIERRKLTDAMRAEVRRRCADTCQGCGDTHGPFHIDHIVPVSRGGLTVLDNLTLLCAACNILKSNHSWDEYLERLRNR